MYYSELFFNKELYSVNEEDIINFFNNSQEETSILEFKSGDVSLEKIYKEISALHNSQGGILIIGSPKPKKDENGKEYFEGELTNSIHKNKDWLYRKIYSKVSPPPVGIKIHDVKFKNGNLIQILDIPKSMNPPHQCLDDGKYYIRFETETKHAPHGLVEALFNLRKEPIFENNLEILGKNIHLWNNSLNIKLGFTNVSSIPANKVNHINYFFNIYKVFKDSKEIELESGHKVKTFFDSNQNTNSILVRGLHVTNNYNVITDKAFAIVSLIWSVNMNLFSECFLFNNRGELYDRFVLNKENVSEGIANQIMDLQRNRLEKETFKNEGFESFLNALTKE